MREPEPFIIGTLRGVRRVKLSGGALPRWEVVCGVPINWE